MFIPKKALLCLGLVVSSACAHVDANFRKASNQRIADAVVKVLLSDAAKKESVNFIYDLGKVCSNYVTFFVKNVANNIQPKDAQRLLEIVDATNNLLLQFLEVADQLKDMTPDEQEEVMGNLQFEAVLIFCELSDIAPAFEKHANTLIAAAQNQQDQTAFALVVVQVLAELLQDLQGVFAERAQN